uniref:cell division protein ZapA n=1 Tax=Alistipes sp. TaxID=1872444 RepID=UPI004057917E
MEEKKLTMNLKVAGKPYRVNTRPEKEEAYRLAEAEVNAYIDSFRKGNYKGFEERDYIAMTALHLAIANVQLRQSREVGNEDMKALSEVSKRLDDFLNKL